jgi:putative phosphoribosyl transferase
MDAHFSNRRQAGKKLAAKLVPHYANRAEVLVLALPRGGVPVAYEVATTLHAPLDVFIVRKLGVPGYEELAMGAIGSGGVRVVNEQVMRQMDIPAAIIDSIALREEIELQRRERLYRGDRPAPNTKGRVVILIDDGLATGSTMRAAVIALRQMQPSKVIVAVPVAAPDICEEFRSQADEVICAVTPEPFMAVGAWYSDFSQTSDEEVRELLKRALYEQHDASLLSTRV